MNKPSWTVRRRIIIATLLFCGFVVGYITIWGDARPVLDTVVIGAFGLALSVIGSYIFGAVWDDRNVMKEFGPAAYVRTPEPEAGQPTIPPQIDGPESGPQRGWLQARAWDKEN